MIKWLRGCGPQTIFVLVFAILLWVFVISKLLTDK